VTVTDVREEGRDSGGRRPPTPPVLSVTKDAGRLTSPAGLALLYLLALAAAEALTALVEPRTGLALHALLLVTLLAHTALNWNGRSRDLLLCLGFAPLIRLLSLSMPLAGFPLITWYLIISVPLFAAAALAARALGYSRESLGLTLRRFPVQLLVGLTGLAFGYVEYLILAPEPLTQALTWEAVWAPALILLLCTGFAEELIFRGAMLRAACGLLGELDVLYVSAVFAALHIGYLSLLDVLFVFWVALFFGWVVARTGSLLGVTLSHGLTNITLFLIVPFLMGAPSAPSQPALATPPTTATTAASAPLLSTFTPSPGETLPPAAASSTPLVTAAGSALEATATRSAVPSPTPTAGPLVHVVQPGENLYQIGLSYGVTWQALAAANGLEDARSLPGGQALVIPAPEPGTRPALGAPPPLPTTHRVQPGENLYRIGLLYGVPWQALAAANQLSDADTVYAGQILVIRRDMPQAVSTLAPTEGHPSPEPMEIIAPTSPPAGP
jgi:LysM repeat protein/membrane protease YdiL (CAAX protease family)